jgi:hypothetical protein
MAASLQSATDMYVSMVGDRTGSLFAGAFAWDRRSHTAVSSLRDCSNEDFHLLISPGSHGLLQSHSLHRVYTVVQSHSLRLS